MPDRLRILFVTEDDPLYVIRLFEVFFREYPVDRMEICGITIDRAFHEPPWKTLRRMLRFYGPWGVARLSTRFLRAKLSGRSIARLAQEKGVSTLPAASVYSPAHLARVRRLAPGGIVPGAGPESFRSESLRIPRRRCMHPP